MPPSLAQNREPFCSLIAQNDGAQGAMVRRMNSWPFMRLRLPEKPEPDGARYAPSSPSNGLRRQPMKGHLMRAMLPGKPGPHWEAQSQSLVRPWVKKRPMKTCVTPGNVSPKAQSGRALWTPLEAAGRGKKRAGMGMTPTPPSKASPGGKGGVPGDETSAIPARSLRTATRRGGAQNRKRP